MPTETIDKRNRNVEDELLVVSYTKEEIEQLILDDMESKGYDVQSIYFNTDYAYVSDDWGMNEHLTTRFLGVSVDTI